MSQVLTEYTEAVYLPGSSVRTEWTFVTQDMAASWLQQNKANRAIRDRHLRRIVADMENDRFLVTHQGVAFADDGTLLDGQHRLMAIAKTGKGQWMLVTSGLPHKAQSEVDGGAKRRVADFRKGQYAALKSATVRILLSFQKLNYTISVSELSSIAQDITSAELLDFWDTMPPIDDDLAALALNASKNLKGVVGPSALLAGALYYPDVAEEFLKGLYTMEGLQTGDPRLALLRTSGGNTRANQYVAVVLTMKAMKAYRNNEKVSIMRYTKTQKVGLK